MTPDGWLAFAVCCLAAVVWAWILLELRSIVAEDCEEGRDDERE